MLRFFQLFPYFAFLSTNILQVALEDRQLGFLRIRLVTHGFALAVLRPGLLFLANLAKQIVFLFLKLAVAGLQGLDAAGGRLLFR